MGGVLDALAPPTAFAAAAPADAYTHVRISIELSYGHVQPGSELHSEAGLWVAAARRLPALQGQV